MDAKLKSVIAEAGGTVAEVRACFAFEFEALQKLADFLRQYEGCTNQERRAVACALVTAACVTMCNAEGGRRGLLAQVVTCPVEPGQTLEQFLALLRHEVSALIPPEVSS
jgi:hypothetical protein